MNTKTAEDLVIIRRNGMEVKYDRSKIVIAIGKANDEFQDEKDRLTNEQIDTIVDNIEKYLLSLNYAATVEDIQDQVIYGISEQGAYKVSKAYTEYRYKQAMKRNGYPIDKNILTLVNFDNEEIKQENSNKNPEVASVQRDYVAGELSRDITRRILLSKEIVDAHDQGIIHFHDMDYFIQRIYNCCLINMEDMLQNGTVISETMIESPKSFFTACNVATQIIAQVASNQYGGQTFSLAHLAPFVDVSRKKLMKQELKKHEALGMELTEEQLHSLVREDLLSEIKSGIQTIQYQILTLMTTNGQTPFVSMCININEVEDSMKPDMALLIEEVLRQRIYGIKNEKGVLVTPAFPKILYILDENNAYEGSEYFYLTELAAKCSAARMVPDYISAKKMREYKNGDVYPCMGCRSFLTPDRFSDTLGNLSNAKNFVEGKHKYYGRFNQGVVTLNLVDVALSSGKDMEKFWQILEDRLELCHRALRKRHERLLGTPSDIAPILFQHGAIARLKKGEPIDKLLYHGYSTISLGYCGIYEMCMYMTGKSHTTEEGREFSLSVMQKLNDKCGEWKKAEDIDYSVYGTPIESTTYRFAKLLQKRFGVIPGITDHNYITNSYHCVVREEINAFDKLTFEADFQKLSPGGAISYIETPNMTNNIEAEIKFIQHMYENIIYAEINSKFDYCMECGYEGEIQIKEEPSGKLIWECPSCGNHDQNKMSVARRTCGYIGTQFWNQGRTQEIKERVLHVSLNQFNKE